MFIEADSTIRGEKLSAWFELPINEYEFMGKLGVEIDSNDYRITEKKLPFADDVGEDTTVDRLNELYQMADVFSCGIGVCLPGETELLMLFTESFLFLDYLLFLKIVVLYYGTFLLL